MPNAPLPEEAPARLTVFDLQRCYHRRPMAEFNVDPYVDLYARRTSGMSASEVRALFAVASRPEVVSLAGGMPYVQALPAEQVLEIVEAVLTEKADVELPYGGGQGWPT